MVVRKEKKLIIRPQLKKQIAYQQYMGSEYLPFNNFGMNGAFNALMVISHFIIERGANSI